MLVEESGLAYVEPGVTVHGMDIGDGSRDNVSTPSGPP
jgi:hypothetical protein